MKIHEHKIIKIKDLKPYDYNTRDHSNEQIMQVKESIKKYGFTNPLLIDEKNNIIAGHCRLEAIKALNNLDFKDNPILELPCVIVKDLSEVDFKALSIIDNKLALNATWNEKNLLNELESLEFVNFDLSELGFSESEINNIMGESEINNIMGESEINNIMGESEINNIMGESEIKEIFKIVLEFENENELESNYNKLTEMGYKCKILTL